MKKILLSVSLLLMLVACAKTDQVAISNADEVIYSPELYSSIVASALASSSK